MTIAQSLLQKRLACLQNELDEASDQKRLMQIELDDLDGRISGIQGEMDEINQELGQ